VRPSSKTSICDLKIPTTSPFFINSKNIDYISQHIDQRHQSILLRQNNQKNHTSIYSTPNKTLRPHQTSLSHPICKTNTSPSLALLTYPDHISSKPSKHTEQSLTIIQPKKLTLYSLERSLDLNMIKLNHSESLSTTISHNSLRPIHSFPKSSTKRQLTKNKKTIYNHPWHHFFRDLSKILKSHEKCTD